MTQALRTEALDQAHQALATREKFHIMAAGTCSVADGWKPLSPSVAEPGVKVGLNFQGPEMA
ncbi:MAG: hypothetical protein LRY54_01160 [Alphaproteobacteria bacterium]|nr:hypothetical protein [Alphaproteobacteria bacterium]